jgi:superfamily II DNA or RNA helicase
MSLLKQTTPIRINLLDFSDFELKQLKDSYLRYIDKKVDFEILKLKDIRRWIVAKHGQAEYDIQLENLKNKRIKSLLIFDETEGVYWTYSGLKNLILDNFPKTTFVSEVAYPKPHKLAWQKETKVPREYQSEAKSSLLAVNHGGVEIGTGLGKSFIIQMLLRELGLQAVVMAPSRSIARQLYQDCCESLGKKNVGLFGDGKKELGKLITIGISNSLANVKPKTKEYDFFTKTQVFIADESHLCPANTLASVCFDLVANAPYRFFFSGTQLRNDGADLLLDAITNDIVYRLTVKDGVDMGYLSKPVFRIVQAKSPSSFQSNDANDMTRAHLYYNPKVNEIAGNIANECVDLQKPTLILIEEVEQLSRLIPYLKHKFAFAHGGLNKGNVDKVPAEYHKSDPEELVAEFNAGKIPILIGTSCISTGTNIRVVESLIYLQGGKSEIQVKQAIGRGTRGGFKGEVFNPWTGNKKLECWVFDFDVQLTLADQGIHSDVDPSWSVLHRHNIERTRLFKSIHPTVEII